MRNIVTFIIGVIIAFLIFSKPVTAADENIAGASGTINNDDGQSQKKKEVELMVKKVKTLLDQHDSPLTPYAEVFVKKAQEYDLDWKMVVSIAGVESTFGKHVPNGSYNGWGWGIPTGASSGIGFKNWEEGITVVSKGLREKYVDRGLDTVEKMGPVYAPPSNTWANNVRFFMSEIENVSVKPELSI